jgi:RND family efflux transporter MFP subunit
MALSSDATFYIWGEVMHRRLSKMVLVAGAVVALVSCREEPKLIEQVRAVKTITVAETAGGAERQLSGIVQATDSSSLSFQVGGTVQEIRVDIGDQVTKDQVIAVLDKEPFELDVKSAEAELIKAQADEQHKKAEYARRRSLYERDVASKSELDVALYAYRKATSDVNNTRAKLNLTRRDLNSTTLKAPFDGAVAARSVDAFVEVTAGQEIVKLDAKGTMEAAFDIPETIVSRVAKGASVSIAFPTAQGRPIQGNITFIGSAAGTANAFPAKARLTDPPDTIRPGMTADVTVPLTGSNDQETAYLVPVTALAPGDEPEQGYVFVYDKASSTVKRKTVRIRPGVGTDALVPIQEGIQAGDVIAVAGVTFLTDGQRVKLMQP